MTTDRAMEKGRKGQVLTLRGGGPCSFRPDSRSKASKLSVALCGFHSWVGQSRNVAVLARSAV